MFIRPWLAKRHTDSNSDARMVQPIGMTKNAGPGWMIIATPARSTTPPTIATPTLRAMPLPGPPKCRASSSAARWVGVVREKR